jgi:hypothetical protein
MTPPRSPVRTSVLRALLVTSSIALGVVEFFALQRSRYQVWRARG